METCEVCGKATDELYLARIEEATMWVCASCSKGKQILQSLNTTKETPRQVAVKRGENQEELIENFGESIRQARERLGLPIKVLAEKISEKESELVRVEKEKTLPSETLRKKLEKELGIKLTTKSEQTERGGYQGKREPVTLGEAAFSKEDADKEEGE